MTLEVDGRDSDLLGLVKDFIAQTEKGLGKVTANTKPSAKTLQAAATLSPFSHFLADKSISDILKDVHRIHAVSYQVPATVVASAGTTANAIAFHEPSLVREGGRRILYSNAPEKAGILIMGFDAPRGTAIILDEGEKVTVIRTEGSINFKALTAALMIWVGVSSAEADPTPPAPAVQSTGNTKTAGP